MYTYITWDETILVKDMLKRECGGSCTYKPGNNDNSDEIVGWGYSSVAEHNLSHRQAH